MLIEIILNLCSMPALIALFVKHAMKLFFQVQLETLLNNPSRNNGQTMYCILLKPASIVWHCQIIAISYHKKKFNKNNILLCIATGKIFSHITHQLFNLFEAFGIDRIHVYFVHAGYILCEIIFKRLCWIWMERVAEFPLKNLMNLNESLLRQQIVFSSTNRFTLLESRKGKITTRFLEIKEKKLIKNCQSCFFTLK